MQQGLRTVSLDDGNVQTEVDRLTAIVLARMQVKEKTDEGTAR